ncbi:hypothetical protein CWD94_24180, partial [Lysinibacillus xylanilyticus]
MRTEPMHKISRKGLTVWRLYGVLQTLLLLIVAAAACYGTYYFEWPSFIYFIAVAVVILSA